jgi:VWFA-related protein
MLIDGMACLWPADLEFQRAGEALDQLGDDAEIALMAWDSDVVLVHPFTMDRNLITSRLEDRACFFHALNGPKKVVRPERDWYRPGEAIHKAAAYLETAASPLRRKIILTLVTSYGPPTLMAETHRLSAAEVEGKLEKSGATVYALYLTERRVSGPMPLFGRFMPTARRRRSGGTLERFVEQTGGSVIVGKRKAPDEWLIKLAGLIRTSYSIGYYPDDKDFDGRFRHIKLELSRSGKTKAGTVNIKMRNGYRALRPSRPVVSEKNLER